jgi:hypothetical protein
MIEPAKMIGLVFNGERRSRAGYYGYSRAYAGSPRLPRRESRAGAR